MCFATSKVHFGSLPIINVEIDPNPKQEGPVRGSHGFGSTQKPPVLPFRITNPKGYLSPTAGAETCRPDPASLFVIVWMQEGNVGIPLSAEVDSETKRMILRQF